MSKVSLEKLLVVAESDFEVDRNKILDMTVEVKELTVNGKLHLVRLKENLLKELDFYKGCLK